MSNKLPLAKRVQILSMLCEGSSMRSISRVVDVSINTVSALLVDAGKACAAHHDATVVGVKAKRIQADEIWSFCYAKQKNVATAKAAPERTLATSGPGPPWTPTASSSVLPIGGRDAGYANEFMQDVAARLANRVQLTTDGHKAGRRRGCVRRRHPTPCCKHYGDVAGAGRYSPGICTGATQARIEGRPEKAHVSTSYAERQNLTMRMSMRRFTRLTNAFSKKAENHAHMVALYTCWYNFIRQHKTLRVAPAMAAGLSDKLWGMENVVALIDARAEAPKARGAYKPRVPKTASISN